MSLLLNAWAIRAHALRQYMDAMEQIREDIRFSAVPFTHAERRAYESRVCGIDNRWQDYLRSKRK